MKIEPIEIDIILKALDALRSQRLTTGAMKELVTAVLAPRGKEKELRAKLKQEEERGEEEHQKLLEDIDVLKGKLILMRRELVTEGL